MFVGITKLCDRLLPTLEFVVYNQVIQAVLICYLINRFRMTIDYKEFWLVVYIISFIKENPCRVVIALSAIYKKCAHHFLKFTSTFPNMKISWQTLTKIIKNRTKVDGMASKYQIIFCWRLHYLHVKLRCHKLIR